MFAVCAVLGCHSAAGLRERTDDAGAADAPPRPQERAAIDARVDATAFDPFDFTQNRPALTWSVEWTAAFLDEPLAKREEGADSFPMRELHLVFEEWFDVGHVRVSVRGDGWYAIELDGGVRASGPRHGSTYRQARDFYTAPKGGFPFLHHFGSLGFFPYLWREVGGEPPLPAFPPCPPNGDDGSGPYHAQMSLTLEHRPGEALRSWWTSPRCAGFPRAIALEAWSLIEHAAGGRVTRPAWYPLSPKSPREKSPSPDCRGFGGRIHGASSCLRVDLKSGRSAPISVRADGPGATSLSCGTRAIIEGREVAMTCATVPAPDAGAFVRRVEISVSFDGGPPILVDTHEGGWDFIHAWARPESQALNLTIDYGVHD
ncbi:MAG TPA: hypothetical protein VNO55_01665 [Polyangia bacterium]|nr:hypothetical protein [Polyangia bacterium]